MIKYNGNFSSKDMRKLKLSVKILIIAIITLLCLALLAYSVIGVILLGPSEDASRMALEKLYGDDMTKFIPALYMSKEKATAILNSFDNGESIENETVVINGFDE